MKKIAVLMTGRTRTIADIAPRIVEQFKGLGNSGYDVDFFCHQTADDIVIDDHEEWASIRSNLKTGNIPPDWLRERVNPTPLTDVSALQPRHSIVSSYHELIDLYETHYDRWGKSRDIMGIGYLSQAYSVSYASKAMVEYATKTGTTYSYVIKWRYDLVPEFHTRKNVDPFGHINRRQIYFNGVTENESVNDTWFVAPYATASWAFPLLGDYYLDQMLKRFSTPRLDSAKFEETLHDVVVHGLKCKPLPPQPGQFTLHSAIYRDGCTPDMTVEEILDYNQNVWVNQGWERLVLNNRGVKLY